MDISQYNEFVDRSPQGCVFCKSWWLDAVAPNQYRIITVEKGGEIVAAWPIIIKKIKGLSVCTMPPLTQTLGIIFRASTAKYTNQLSEQKKIINELVEQLPKVHYFKQNFNYNFTNWLPLYWKGFKQTTRYTYVLEDLSNLDAIWKSMRENIRREIRKAVKIGVVVRDDLNIDDFLNVNELTFFRQGKKMPYPRELVNRLDMKCQQERARKIFFAVDKKDKIHAVLYLVWDKRSSYYLMGGGDPSLRNSGATSLLVWEAIKFASTVTKRFDFEGSMIEPVERFFRAFGAIQKPYFSIWKFFNPFVEAAYNLRSMFRG